MGGVGARPAPAEVLERGLESDAAHDVAHGLEPGRPDAERGRDRQK